MRIKKVFKVSIIIVFLACILSIFYFNSKTIMFSSNMNKGIDAFKGHIQDIVKVIGEDGNDKIKVFED